jgi:peptidylprolyl isomerase
VSIIRRRTADCFPFVVEFLDAFRRAQNAAPSPATAPMMLVCGVIKPAVAGIELLSFSLRGLMSPQRIFVSAILLALAAVPLASKPAQAAGEVTTPSGLRIIDVKTGTGPVPHAGQTVTVNYTGWLFVDDKKGKKFDSSLDRGEPFSFTLGQGQVIRGWDEGLATMHVGGKRTLIIPPDLGYGASGAGGVIPPGATLVFDVDLLGVK